MNLFKNFGRWKRFGIVLTASFLIALLSHAFLIGEWLEGRYFTGMGDGLSQMLPFKKMLYDLYSSGEFFYNESFGLGGGVYSQLGYYYATSLLFWMQCGITYILEMTGVLAKHPDLFYWANMILVVSVIRLTAIIIAAYYYFRKMRFGSIAAVLAASIYGTSIIYFRHVMYWEFFADAMLWLPLLLWSVERVIREGKSGLFTVMVAVSLFDNFYFAYINLLLTCIYIIVRWFIRLTPNELGRMKQLKRYIQSGIIGSLISAVSFIPSAYGFLNNERPPYKGNIPLFEMPDNFLLSGKIMIVVAFTIFCLFLFSFYKNKKFRFFAMLVILSMLMHLSPVIASLFNGLSAPQYRWEYFLGICTGGLAATGFEMLRRLKWKEISIAFVGAGLFYYIFYRFDEDLYLISLEEWKQSYLLMALIVVYIGLIAFFLFKRRRGTHLVLACLLITVSIGTVYEFQSRMLAGEDSKRLPTTEYMNGAKYNGADQNRLIRKIEATEKDPHARIDWMIPTRNNTPIVESFNGMSVYSSILNKHLLNFYLYDLKIDMGRESVSRYATMGGRANLYALFQGKYLIVKKGNEANVPYGFKPFAKVGNYLAYENTKTLPFIRTTDTVYSSEQLNKHTVLEREQAMLAGVVMEGHEVAAPLEQIASLPSKEGRQLDIQPVSASYKRNVLDIKGNRGGIDISVKGSFNNTEDLYVEFHLERLINTSPNEYELAVNDYSTLRKANTSIYRTFADDLAIRVPYDDKISLRLPKGKYELRDIRIQGENYSLLNKLAAQKNELKEKIDWNGGSKFKASLQNKNGDRYAVLPIPFERGWKATVNGKRVPIEQANYAYTAIELKQGNNIIQLKYWPPYFGVSLILSVLGLISALLIHRDYNKKKEAWTKEIPMQ